jgi:hypothetical protein
MKPGPFRQVDAEGLAIRALGWLASDADLTGGFLAAAGAVPGDLRARAGDPEFLGFVLDFLMGNEQALLEFSTAEGITPDLPMRARAALPGGDLPNWT